MSSTTPNVPSRSSSISATRRGRSSSTRRDTTKRDSWSQDLERQAEFLKKHISSISTDIESIRPRSRSSPAPKMSRDHSAAPPRSSPRSIKAQRWAGLTRSVSTWDDLRKDPELWSPDGDCHVHLYARGASRRGPSFRVPLRALRQKNCSPMLTVCYAQSVSGASTERLVSFANLNRGPNHVELYIPAPDDASKEDAFDWHITTRNFFAYVLGKPLVGHHMGEAFVNLQERMKLFRAVDADHHQDFLQYIEEQGYRDVVECTDYALASLYYAERYKLRTVWIDAFTHCVGMNDSLALSPEFSRISRLTKALITRASLEVDIHLDNVAKAMRTFLEEDFSPAYIGLPDGARSHMDRFRRFLHHYYTKKFGYWPPPRSTTTFPKALYQSMFYDFTNLYDYLVDTSSTTDISSQKPASGGICVLQNLDQFDKRHKFISQPHPLPLLPELEQLSNSSGSQRLSRTLSTASQSRKRDNKLKKSAALAAAANIIHPNVVNSKIVRAYMDFEKSYATSSSQRDEKLSTVDGRKVRWLVIYGSLQYLSSVLQAPKHVRDTESPEYPLCSLVSPHSAWSVATPLTTPPTNDVIERHSAMDDYFGSHTGSSMASSEIQPDCQREDYFGSQKATPSEPVEIPAPLKLRGSSRQNSLRSFAPLQSLSAFSSRRNSLKLASTDDILKYRSSTTASSSIQHTRESSPAPARKLESANEEVDWLERRAPPTPPESPPVPASAIRGHNRKRTPLLHSFQLDEQNHPASPVLLTDAMSRSDSTSSNTSSIWSDGGSAASSKSSVAGGFLYKGNAAEYSGLLGGLVSLNGSPTQITFPEFHEGNVHPLLRRSPAPKEDFEFGFDQEPAEPSSSSETVGQVGMAVSDEAVPPPIELQKSAYPRAMQQYTELERPSTSSTVKPSKSLSRKNSCSMDVLSIKRPGLLGMRYSEMPVGQSKNNNPPPVTKTSHAGATSAPTKTPSLMVRILSDDRKQKIKDRRLSSFFRR